MKSILKKLLEREAYIPIGLIVIATVALFVDRATFSEWAPWAAAFGGLSVGSLTARKMVKGDK